jgi:hypothetical protein
MPETANQVHRLEAEKAQQLHRKGGKRRNSVPKTVQNRAVNGAAAAPEDVEDIRSSGDDRLSGVAPLDECANCGERRPMVGDLALYCAACLLSGAVG